MPLPATWTVPATVDNVVDGDTVDLILDLGYRIHHHIRARLYGINAPEMRGDDHLAGRASREHLESLIYDYRLNTSAFLDESDFAGPVLQVESHKNISDKYGRWIIRLIGVGDIDLNRLMVMDGHAKAHDYDKFVSPYH